jgi:clan AA aspartic protease
MPRLLYDHVMTPTMGTFRLPIEIGNLSGGRFDRLEALVDTGASHTSWPSDRLRELGVEPQEQWPFVVADGREVMYDVAWAQVRIGDRSQPTIVVFADPGSEPLLGAFTLEGFRLAADPIHRRLISVPGSLKAIAA